MSMEKAKLLLVDDEPLNLMALQALLADMDCEFVTAASGREALRKVLLHDYALIVLDVQLPDLDGFETARLIRQRRRSYDTPIMFLTAHHPEEMDMFKGYEVGAVDYMIKPPVPAVLRSKVAVFVDLYKKNAEILERKQVLHRAVKVSEQRFYDLVQGLDAIVWEADPLDHCFSFVSKQAERILGYPVEHWTTEKNFRSKIIHPSDSRDALIFYRGAIDYREGREIVYRAVSQNGENIWVRDNVHVVHDEKGRPMLLRGVMVDITAHKLVEQQLAQLAHHDALTGLPNRVMLEKRLNAIMSSRSRYTDNMAAVLFFDLDGFKTINDTLGHHVGDALLKTISERLRRCIRENDMAARLGGDEFIAIVDMISSQEEAAHIAQKILRHLSQPMVLDREELSITCSIGVSLFPQDGRDAKTLLRNADVAMYSAKEQGKNTFQFYTPEMHARLSQRRALENALRRAVERQEFLLYYQPKIALATGALAGLEALLRWDNPGAGITEPEAFIPLLEETGMIIEAGEWAIRAACLQNRTWQEYGLPPVRIAVNLSARQFQQKTLPKRIQDILVETGTDPCHLELEVTESMVMENPQSAVRMLHDIRDIGVTIAIDDFGTGHSSLAALKRYPISSLKIDKSFVAGLPNDDDASIALAVIAMAKSMGLKVIAEGVESQRHLDFLTRERCEECQGNFISPPLCAEDMGRFLATYGGVIPDGQRNGLGLRLV